jgi:hypothetical protein
MKFRIFKTSQYGVDISPYSKAKFDDTNDYWYVDIDSLGDLKAIQDEVNEKYDRIYGKKELIISFYPNGVYEIPYIEIYDDWRE